MFKKRHPLFVSLALVLFLSMGCHEKSKSSEVKQTDSVSGLRHATGFSIVKNPDYTVLQVSSAWPGAKTQFTYALVPREKLASISLPTDTYAAIVPTPVKQMVITSTTHIASLEMLGELEAVVGFPNTDLISSKKARKLVDSGSIKELGSNEEINTEMVLEQQPEILMGFGINDTNKAYETLKTSGIPIVYNGDWTESTPLGKAEWIKFFAPFFQKEQLADRMFENIESSYTQAKLAAQNATHRPTVITGGLYKDVWYVAGGASWMSQFLEDANADYLWGDTQKSGSIGLSLEAVLEKGQQADFWFNPSLHTSYKDLEKANLHYRKFKAFSTEKVFSNAMNKGATGGLLFYELAPQRPDLVLLDLISILHPELLNDHEPQFYLPLQ